MIYGGRISLAVGFAAMAVASVIGVVVGALAGMSRRLLDPALMWLTDLFLSLPQLPLLLLVIYLFRDSLKAVFGSQGGVFLMIVAVIGGLRWMPVARLVRAQFLTLREKEFVEAARSQGATNGHLVRRHILPNALGPVIVAASIEVSSAIIAESTLSFLGLGFPPDIPTWGRLLYDAKDHLDVAPHLGAVPRGGDLSDRAVDQLHRRWVARCARPAPGDIRRWPRDGFDPLGRRSHRVLPLSDGRWREVCTASPSISAPARPWRWWANPVGQERQRPVGPAPPAARCEPHRRPCALSGAGSAHGLRVRDAAGARRFHRHDLSGADDLPESGPDDRIPDFGGADPAQGPVALRRRGRGPAPSRQGPDSGGAIAAARIPAPLLGRHAPAGDDRDGAGVPSEAPHRRRADHSARRDDSGADPRPHQEPAGRRGHVGPVHHPRHGRGGRDRRPHGGDVSRQGGGNRADGADLLRSRRALHPRAARLRAPARGHGGAAVAADALPRHRPGPARRSPRPRLRTR